MIFHHGFFIDGVAQVPLNVLESTVVARLEFAANNIHQTK